MSLGLQIQELAATDVSDLVHRVQGTDPDVDMAVQGIHRLVQQGGDKSIRELTRRLDGASVQDLLLKREVWSDLAAQCPADVQGAIDGNLRRIRAFHEAQVHGETVLDVAPGVRLGRRPVAYTTVGCYVPGGRASYPSSVLMTVAPARLAGVERIVVATPPNKEGAIDPAVAYAAKAAGATDILLAGGAQAVFALALGTETVPQAQAIVGPGNAYVTAAKRMVSEMVHTDAPAGPSELLVLADATADAGHVALDLMAQAEHDPDAQVVLVSTDAGLAEAVVAELERRVPDAARADIITKSLQDNGAFFVAPLDPAIDFTNAYAPEHLEIITQDPEAILTRIQNAGSVFLGPNAPVSLGDYGSGTNHVLPTMGFATLRGGLAVDDFRKWVTWQSCTPDGLAQVASDVATLARAEGLIAHAEAVEQRVGR